MAAAGQRWLPPQLGQPGAENTLRIVGLRVPLFHPASVCDANSRGAFPGPFISPAAGYYDRARRSRNRDREMFAAIFLSPDDNDGAREYFITALSHQPDFPAQQMPVQLENIAHTLLCTFAPQILTLYG